MTTPLLQVENLRKQYPVGRRSVRAVDDVSFAVPAGQTVALVGESGCGKSTTGLATLRLIEPSGGRITFDGTDVTTMGRRQLRAARSRMQIVLQNPRSQLDPRMRIRDSVLEPLRAQRSGTRAAMRDRVAECLELVGLPADLAPRYPHQLSGGQRQRVAIARALATEPELIVLDEAVSALDASVQVQVMNLLQDLQQRLGLSYVFISHNMAAVRYLAHRVVVMYLGQSVETAPADELFTHPAHPYTEALLSAVPSATRPRDRQRIVLRGDTPSPFERPTGCVLRTRCPRAQDICATTPPPPRELAANHTVSCHFPIEHTD
jgi:oligopeptide/dipeptide ABC transporter ATP-binding protein